MPTKPTKPRASRKAEGVNGAGPSSGQRRSAPKATRAKPRARPLAAKSRGSKALPHWEVLGVSDAREIAKEEIDWVIPDVLSSTEKVMIAGPPKQLKTWLSLHVSRCCVLQEPLFGNRLWTPAESQPVLFVQEEGARQRWASRVARTFPGTDEVPNFKYVHRGRFDLTNDQFVDQVIADAEDHESRMIILDPYQRMIPGIDENSSGDTGPAWDAIHEIASETGAAVIVLHHTRKDSGVSIDAIRGSIRAAGEVDLLIIMRKTSNGVLEVNLDGRELRDPEGEDDGNLRVTYGEPPWRMHHEGHTGKKKERTVQEMAGEVLAVAESWLTVEDVRLEVLRISGRATLSKQAVQDALNLLETSDPKRAQKREIKGGRGAYDWARLGMSARR